MQEARVRDAMSLSHVAHLWTIHLLAALAVIIAAVWLPLELRELRQERERDRGRYLETRREMLRLAVDQIGNFISFKTLQAIPGGVIGPQTSLQQEVIQWIKRYRFSKNGYVWAMRTDFAMVVHPYFTLERRPQWYQPGGMADFRDPEGRFLFRQMLEIGTTRGSGFLEYLWDVPGQDRAARKMSYVKLMKEWGWIIGAGMYLEDIEAALLADQSTFRRTLIGQTFATAALLIGAIIAAFLAFRTLMRKANASLCLLQCSLRNAELERRPIDVRQLSYMELRAAADFANHMLAAQNEADQRLARSEEQLRQTQKMEALGRLTGCVAHDFNNMLTAIQGYSEMLLAKLGLDEEARDWTREIQRSAQRAGSLTLQLLAFGRREPAEEHVVDLNALVTGMGSMLRRTLGETIELRTRLGAVPRTDPGKSGPARAGHRKSRRQLA